MDRVCFYIGNKPVYWYGVLVATGLAAAWAHLRRLGRMAGFDEQFVSNMVLIAMLGGLVGARVAYVASNWPDYAGQWMEIIRIDHGGLVFYGGAVGAALALSLHAALAKVPWRRYADFIITGLPLGHAFGRIGCFLNGCCYGRACSCGLDWLGGRWPVQLMETVANLFIYGVLTRMYRRCVAPGMVFVAYLLTYPTVRFVLEFLRGDPRTSWGGLHVAQWMSLALVALGGFLGWVWKPRRRTPEV